jgi:cell division protein ZapA
MTLIDIALMYERERGKNDTAPYNDVLAKLTSEIEEALK